jgi:predicted amino acid-binding ACT domain protein
VPDEIRVIHYYYATVPDKPGEAARVLSALNQAGINLLGVSAFPHGLRRSQLDLIPEDSAAFAKAAKGAGLMLSKKRSGFLIQGEDRIGVIAEITSKLADADINITSVQTFCAGSGRYGGMLWVKAADLRKAAKALAVGVGTSRSASELATRL